MGHKGLIPGGKVGVSILIALAIVFGLILLGLGAGYPGEFLGRNFSLGDLDCGGSSSGEKVCAAGAFSIITGALGLIIGTIMIIGILREMHLEIFGAVGAFFVSCSAMIALGLWAWVVDQQNGSNDIANANVAFAVLSWLIWIILTIDYAVAVNHKD